MRTNPLPSATGGAGLRRASLLSADRATPEIGRPGSRAWKFSRGQFIRSGIAAFSANLCVGMKVVLAANRLLAGAMGQRANVRADRQGFSCSSAQHSEGTQPEEWLRWLFYRGTGELFAAPLRARAMGRDVFCAGRRGNDFARCPGRTAEADDAFLRRWR